MKIGASRYLVLFCTTLFLSNSLMAKNLYVIANNTNPATSSNVKEIFLGERQIAGDVKVTPFENSNAQSDFLDKVLKLDASKYASMWAKRGFRDGLNPPAVKNTDAEVIAAVKANPGGLGYVGSAPSGVRIVTSFLDPAIDNKSCEAPKYPKGALLAEVVGTVTLEFFIDVDGKVLESKVAKSSGNASLDNAALSALMLCKFKAGTVDGKPEKARLALNHVWKLD
ncbi:MAG: TonB family protein [Burkholderiaceae bacterium]|nr:TonB family protein [Burkholderiaceae bacterium]